VVFAEGLWSLTGGVLLCPVLYVCSLVFVIRSLWLGSAWRSGAFLALFGREVFWIVEITRLLYPSELRGM
jgi:hypothetical protein